MGVPINNVTRRVVYAASGTGPYAFTFEILAAGDIAVYKDDTLLTVTTDYTVTINTNGTGSITLTAAPTGATQIAIVGNRTIQRTTDFVTGGDLFANTINDELDQQTIFNQQNAEGLQRALQAPQTDPTTINMVLPRASVRANRVLAFDASGNPSATEFIGSNRGNWATSTSYNVRDIVKDTSNSNIYQCLVAHTSSGSQPISSNADVAKWFLLVDAAAAASSASAAASSASAAATSASNASTSASNAASSASTASTQASNASTSATSASNSASAASSSASAAASSATAAANSYDAFDDRYLGSKASDPTVDNDGNTLLDGALYWDTSNNIMKVYDLGATTWRRTTPTTSDQANINTVSGISANVTTVAGISANVTTVAGISSNVTSVAGNSTNINTVATNIANVNSVGSNIANVNSVAGNATNINAAVSNATNINTVAGISSNVTTVATNNANVTTVAGSIASVNTNATNIANINQNAANITAIQNASTNATNAAASATAAAASATSAASSAASASAVVLGNEPVRPALRPSLLLDFANTKALDPRITFTRSTTATFYDGVTTAKAEENFFTYSQNSTTNWTNFSNRLTITTGYEAAPDGTTTGMRLQNSSGSIGYFYQNVGSNLFVSGTTYTLSVYVKSNTGSTQTAQLMLPVTSATNNISVTTSWTRVTWTVTASSTNSFAGIILDPATATDISVWGFQVEQRSSVTAYTATTTAPITNYIPALQTAAAGVPRFDHNPTTDESLGLLIEEQRTNLLTYSEQFDNAAWVSSNASITANNAVAPDGTLTADKLIANSSLGGHFTGQGLTTTAVAHTFSVYLKAAGYNWAVLYLSGPNVGIFFNLSNGTTGSTFVGAPTSSSITAVGNGWYRCSITATLPTSAVPRIYTASADATATFAGDNFSGLFAWGAQLEAGSFATSYITTVAASVTRNADSASMTGTNFSSWYAADQGTLYVDATYQTTALTSTGLATLSDTAFSQQWLTLYTSPTALVFGRRTNGVTASNILASHSLGTANSIKAVAAYGLTSTDAVCVNGGSVSTATPITPPPANVQLKIGTFATGGNPTAVNGTIRKLAYYPIRVTNAQLQGLTTV